MKWQRLLLILVLGAIVGAFGWTRFATHNVPAGQTPLVALSPATLARLKADFNRAADETRIIILLSPT